MQQSMAFSHILLLRINQIMFARCFSQKKHCTGTTYFYQFKCFTEKCFMKFTPRPRSSLLFSQVYVQTEKKKEQKHLEDAYNPCLNKRVSVLQSCVPYLYPQQYMNVQVDWREGRSHSPKSFTAWAGCLRDKVALS